MLHQIGAKRYILQYKQKCSLAVWKLNYKVQIKIFFNKFEVLQTSFNTLDRLQSNTLILSKNTDQKSLETEFLISICRSTGDKWQ